MKKTLTIFILTAVICPLASCLYVGTGEKATDKKEYYTVTFVQSGEEYIVRRVKKGAALTDIPEPTGKLGYDVRWQAADFDNIDGNLTVYAVETPLTYTITYKLNKSGASIPSDFQEVVFGKEYTLLIPSSPVYDFKKWTIEGTSAEFKSGVWTIAADVTLTAVWTREGWTPYY